MSAVADLQGLSDLSQCAYALGMAFGRQAEAAEDDERRLRFYELFERCFHGYRVAVALKLRLAHAAPRIAASDAEDLRDRDPPDREAPNHEASDHEAPDRDPRERIEYDRDREAASLPILIKTLDGVAAGAEGLPGPHRAELPTLRELLARMAASPPALRPPAAKPPHRETASEAAVAVLARPRTAPAPIRSRLLLGAAPAIPPPRRRATGPPPR
ncbi:MAG: hypothetical protein GC203_03645 [Phenylobacterium sp.]|uniref:hypothetical protein n=1 Tax=Phenylobacterium sp. TaxID=1871053 RepID=UPI0025D0F86D|nr:hypothetical protein [Phenylobacterium sp.]MBI1196933.1 hypothetical protein [Phenylobacterium sp.]